MHFRLDFIIEANTMNPDQTGVILVNIVCNIGYLRTYTDEIADAKVMTGVKWVNPLLHRLFLDHDIIFYFKTALKKFKKN